MTQAETVLLNGRIFCGLAEGFVEALAIGGGKVLAAGSAAEIVALQGPATRVVDLAGRVAIPGLNDAHMHLLPLGLAMSEVNLRPEEGVNSIDEVLRRIAAAVKGKKPGEWVTGRGYDHNELAEARHPTAEELDRVAPDNPVYIKRTCGHVGVVNSRAMAAAGIGHNTPSPDGGLIERRDNPARRFQRLARGAALGSPDDEREFLLAPPVAAGRPVARLDLAMDDIEPAHRPRRVIEDAVWADQCRQLHIPGEMRLNRCAKGKDGIAHGVTSSTRQIRRRRAPSGSAAERISNRRSPSRRRRPASTSPRQRMKMR